MSGVVVIRITRYWILHFYMNMCRLRDILMTDFVNSSTLGKIFVDNLLKIYFISFSVM